jgi:hypothetical protein
MLRRALAPLGTGGFILALAVGALAQAVPAVSPSPVPAASPSPASSAAPVPAGALTPVPLAEPSPDASASPEASPSPLISPTAPPTPVPITGLPAAGTVEPGKTTVIRLSGTAGTIVASVADPAVASVVPDQLQRAVFISGNAVGRTTVTVTDSRGVVTLTVPVRVAFAAGVPADEVSLRVTGNPASRPFLREAATYAAVHAAQMRPGANATVAPESIAVARALPVDDRTALDVPIAFSGDGYLDVTGITHVDVENFALPRIQPSMLLVSDYPERLTANGVLFTADLERREAKRFLYYHYNPSNQPARRILLRVQNPSTQPATVQFISGSAGPGANEMEVGHLSTQRFLVHEFQNEGVVLTIPGGATIDLAQHLLPPGTIVSALLQLREIDGAPLQLTLVAQDAKAPLDQSVTTTELLSGGVPHARGEYQVPEFYFDYSYDVDGDNLEIPIGQLPLPNLRRGQALSGDYGVQQSVTVTIVNPLSGPMPVAMYANPRGGRATGTFLIDGTIVQAHALPAFSKYKIWQETIAPHTFRRVQIVTMPEGGSSYPLRLIFAPDDGSVPPGAPGSLVY